MLEGTYPYSWFLEFHKKYNSVELHGPRPADMYTATDKHKPVFNRSQAETLPSQILVQTQTCMHDNHLLLNLEIQT